MAPAKTPVDPEGKDEHRKALKADLQALWAWVKTQLSEEEKSKQVALMTELDALLAVTSDDFKWIEANKAQLLMLSLLPKHALDAQFRHAMENGRQSGMPMGKYHEDLVERLLKTGVTPEPQAKQEGYRAFLSELQQYFLNRRFRRKMRLEMAVTLLWFAGVILFFAALPIAVFALAPQGDATSKVWFERNALVKDPIFCFGAALVYGILGAFFSRLVSFQSRLQTYGFEALLHNFSGKFVAVRCAVGMFGALIIFLLMRSGLLGGSMFVDQEDFALTKAGSIQVFAKILVWSFVAGWSERLVPETLERTESAANSAQKAGGK